jgi:hypothetical protein
VIPANLDTQHLIALAAALGWACGLRLYAVVFFTGLAGALDWVHLPAGLLGATLAATSHVGSPWLWRWSSASCSRWCC